MSRFKVNDVCELVTPQGPFSFVAPACMRHIGEECVITALCVDTHVSGQAMHAITTRSGVNLAATESCLRKRNDPPADDSRDAIEPLKRTRWCDVPRCRAPACAASRSAREGNGVMDAQLTVGLVLVALILGWIAHEHGLIAYIRRHMRARHTWHQGSRDVALDADRRWM